MLSIVVAIAKNNAIGKDNKLLWRLPNDLKHFKQITTGHNIIMGRKTLESLPKLLPDRHHIVLTRDSEYKVSSEMVSVFNSVEELLKSLGGEEYFVIGGGQIYRELLPYCNKLYLTVLDKEYEGDTYFPPINYDDWTVISEEEGILDDKNLIPHTFITLERK